MGEAFQVQVRSKDPNTQVGACLVSVENRPLGTGFNGPPRLIDDNELDWVRPNKYNFIRHAEENAIKHSCGDTAGATIYVTAPPCPRCMLAIVDAEIARVVYFPTPPKQGSSIAIPETWETTKEIARIGGVALEKFEGDLSWMLDHVQHLKTLGVFDR